MIDWLAVPAIGSAFHPTPFDSVLIGMVLALLCERFGARIESTLRRGSLVFEEKWPGMGDIR